MLLDEQLVGVSTVAIGGHIRPDGDCVGSCLGVYNYISTYFPEVSVDVYLEPIPHIFDFMANSAAIKNPGISYEGYDLFIVLDCGSADRLGNSAKAFEGAKRTLCIDHHVSNSAFADANLIVPDASSTCELVFGTLPEERITKEIAECLYTGIVTDTGVFQYSCTSSATMAIAGKLMDMGIDYSSIVDRVFYEKTYAQNRVMGYALVNSRLYEQQQCIAAVITKAEMDEFGVQPKHLDGIVSQLRVTKDVEVAIFLYELHDGTFKASTRCKGDLVDLSIIAQTYGGGGHKKASGFTVPGEDPWGEVEKIIEKVAAQL